MTDPLPPHVDAAALSGRNRQSTPGSGNTARDELWAKLFPRGVLIWHFIFLPALSMGVVLVLFRGIDRLLGPRFLTGGYSELYISLRNIAIGLLMASVMAFLAMLYRRGYEEKLRLRNQTLEATRDFLSRVIDGSGEGIVTRDTGGLVTSWNPAAELIFGWSSADMLGRGIDRLVPDDPEARAAFRSLEDSLASGRVLKDFDALPMIRKDGKRISVSITMSPMHDAAGKPVGTTGIVRDITSLKEMEAKLVEKETLAAVGELAAVIAHEVRNPLAGIRGGCEILLEGYEESDPRAKIGMEVIHRVDRLSYTVQDLLFFARPKAMDPLPTDLHALLDRLLGMLREDPSYLSVAIRKDYGPEVPVVRLDARQMEQVFLNLFHNACQAMNHRGELTVATRAGDTSVEIAVRDRGPGVPSERLQKIFEPFFTTRSQGTGLGLAICKRIVEAHQGRIEVVSPPGKGATFTVILPRAA